MMYQRSEVVLLPFPFTDLSANKKRPVLILKAPNFQGDFLAVQIMHNAMCEVATHQQWVQSIINRFVCYGVKGALPLKEYAEFSI